MSSFPVLSLLALRINNKKVQVGWWIKAEQSLKPESMTISKEISSSKRLFKMSDSIFASNLKSTCQYFSGPISGKTISRSWRPINRSNDLTKTQNQEIVESSPTLPIQRSSCCFYCHWKTFTFTFLFGKLKRPICYLRWERSLQIGTLARLVTPKMVLLLKGNPFPNALHSGLGISRHLQQE